MSKPLFTALLTVAAMALTLGAARHQTDGDRSVTSDRHAPTNRVAHRATSAAPYSATSPHWSHIRTMVTDFRTGYVSNTAQRNAERAWAAAHFDYVMSGDATSYKALNPGIRILPYALDWNIIQPGEEKVTGLGSAYFADMQQWYQNHPQYSLENAFLHVAGGERTEANRVQFVSWGSRRWAINPGDPGARAYQQDRIRRFAAKSDGVFFDSHSSGDIWRVMGKLKVLEYPDHASYERDMIELVKGIAGALAPKIMMLNTSEYMKPFDYAMATAAGAVHLERMNNPLYAGMPERWRWVDTLVAQHVLVELVTLDSWQEINTARGVFTTLTPGNYASKAERAKMFELASYYMVVPQTPDLVLLDLENAWKVPYSTVWLKAQEFDIGHPRAARRVIQKGRDPLGNGFQVWARDFNNGLVVARTASGWKDRNFSDSTAVSVPLPGGEALHVLHGDGSLGPAVSTVTLRNAEAVIMVRAPGGAAQR